MGDWAFDSEYQNQPHGKDDPIFRKEWIVTNEVEESAVPHDKDADTLIAMDPAYGIKQVNDFTGWTIGKISLRKGPDFGCIYIQDASHDRLDTEKKVSLVFNLHAIYRPTAIFLETDADKKQLHDNIIYRSQEFRVSPPIIPVESGGKDKALRASSVQALVSGGRVKFIRGKYPAFIDELLRFDGTDNCGHDDMVDAFVYLLKQCQVWYLPMAKPKEEDIPKPPSIVDRFRERLKMEQGQNVDVKRLVRFGTATPIRDGGT